MATAYHNLSEYDFNSVPNAENMKFGIVVSEWNFNITGALLNGAVNTLKKHGVKDENILVKTVPGSFELTFGANQMMENCDVDAIIAIGCVIKGDTPHFDYVCMGATQGITELNATGDIHETICSEDCPPNTTSTLFFIISAFLPGVGSFCFTTRRNAIPKYSLDYTITVNTCDKKIRFLSVKGEPLC